MHFVIIFIAVSVVLYVAVTPVYEYFKRKQTIARDEAVRKADAEERRIRGIEDAKEQARKDSDDYRRAVEGSFDEIKMSHGVEFPWSNLSARFKSNSEIRTSFDQTTNKDLFDAICKEKKQDDKEKV